MKWDPSWIVFLIWNLLLLSYYFFFVLFAIFFFLLYVHIYSVRSLLLGSRNIICRVFATNRQKDHSKKHSVYFSLNYYYMRTLEWHPFHTTFNYRPLTFLDVSIDEVVNCRWINNVTKVCLFNKRHLSFTLFFYTFISLSFCMRFPCSRILHWKF